MLDEAFKTLWGNYNVCWEWLGLMFQTPEAYMTSKHFRSLGYMRALAVWSVQWALEKYHPQLFKKGAESEKGVVSEKEVELETEAESEGAKGDH